MIKDIYSLQTPRRIIAGAGSIEAIKDIVLDNKIEKALIITDKGVWDAGLIEKPLFVLKESGVAVQVINSTPPEPEVSHIKKIFDESKDMDCQMIIGIGGGSSMDAAKLLSVLMTNSVSIEELLHGGKIQNPGITTLMVPTTAGTGSEATPNSIVLEPEEELKVGIVSNKLISDYVILDAEMTVKLPRTITANTGIDALTHAIECYTSLKANPFSDTFALRAIKLISGSIREAYTNGSNIDARHDMLLGSFYGGVCIATSSTTAVHALAYPLGSKYRIPHGLSNAILLPYVMEFNKDGAAEKFKDIAEAMGLEVDGLSNEEAADKMVENLYSLIKDMDIKSPLKDKGVSEADLDAMVEGASKVTRLLNNNPKKLTKEDMCSIYKKLI